MLDAYRELIDELADGPQTYRDLVGDYQGTYRSNEDWGVVEVVAHLVDVERLYRGRIQAILEKGEGAYLRSFDPDKAARENDYASKDLAESLDEFARERGETVSLLMTLALKDWELTGVHDEFGILSIEDLVERLINHDALHIEQAKAGLSR